MNLSCIVGQTHGCLHFVIVQTRSGYFCINSTFIAADDWNCAGIGWKIYYCHQDHQVSNDLIIENTCWRWDFFCALFQSIKVWGMAERARWQSEITGRVHSVPNKLCSFIFVWNVDGGESTRSSESLFALFPFPSSIWCKFIYTAWFVYIQWRNYFIPLHNMQRCLRIYGNWTVLVRDWSVRMDSNSLWTGSDTICKVFPNLTSFWHRKSSPTRFSCKIQSKYHSFQLMS